jgi:hypothetical protein
VAAVGDAGLSTALRPVLLGSADPATAPGELERLGRPLGDYLAARARLSRGQVTAAIPLLERAVAGPLPELIGQEARFQLAEARCLAGAEAAGAKQLTALARGASGGADRARAEAGLRRCAFEGARR